jgi:hypothetical protein
MYEDTQLTMMNALGARQLWQYLPPPAWDTGVPAALDLSLQSKQYLEGGALLASSNGLKSISPEQKNSCCLHIAVDFLRSLTPEQVDIIRKQQLPFTKLRPDQQKALLQMPDILGGGYKNLHDRSSETYIWVFALPKPKGVFAFMWIHPSARLNGKDVGYSGLVRSIPPTQGLFDQ